MSWQHYCLIFRLQSPLHIGYRQVGNLMQTRPYVPGRVLWGALTARLVRDYDDGANGQRYAEVGKAVKENFRFGYLWPAIPKGSEPIEKKKSPSLDDLEVRFPWDEKEPPFDYLFLDAYASTALEYEHHSAGEGTLHHVEFIRPYTRSSSREGTKSVYLVGDLFVKDRVEKENPLKYWPKAISNIQLGGERTYGWGRISLEGCILKKDNLLIFPDWKWKENDKNIVIIVQPKKDDLRVPAHVEAGSIKEKMAGYPEPLTAYRFKGTFKFEFKGVYFPPGSLLTDRDIAFEVTEEGFWRALP